jgi:7-keto-8-aminopelargonate synthetase-like enzyme
MKRSKRITLAGDALPIIDKRHSLSIVGDTGLGCVQTLELDTEIVIKTHTFTEACNALEVRL